jgi:hypothetical protein
LKIVVNASASNSAAAATLAAATTVICGLRAALHTLCKARDAALARSSGVSSDNLRASAVVTVDIGLPSSNTSTP